MKKRLLPVVSVLLVAVALLNISWGFLVHKTVHQLAVYELPKSMQAAFFSEMDYLVKNAPRPDLRRSKDSTEAPKHFLDAEAYGDDAVHQMPFDWADAVKRYSKDTLEKYGYVPYVVISMKNRLTNAFRKGDKDSILFYATDLAHYIGDANVPLHTSMNYDGQLTNQKGLHALWESTIPELEIETYNLHSDHKATYLNNPEDAIWTAVRRSNALLTDVFGKEKEVTKNFTDAQKYRIQVRKGKEVKSYTTEFAKAYATALKPTINEQLIHAADLIADFWYTAWVDAGKPDLEKTFTVTGENKSKLKQQLKSFKKNNLIKDHYLIAKEKPEEYKFD